MVCTGGNTSGCDVATIYVIGDVNTLSEIFIGLATMFGSPEWATNDGWGVGANIGLAMTFALLVVGFKTIITQKMDLHYMLASLIIFNVFFVPTMPVQVVDYASGRNSGTITGVPIGIGMVGYAGSTLSYRLTEEISENFSGLDGNGNYSTPFVTGFLDPLVQTLMMRKMNFRMLDADLDATLLSYYANCVEPSINDGVYNESVMESDADPISGYHFNISNINNYLMEFYPKNSDQYLTTCHEAIPLIRGWLKDGFSDAEKSKAIQKTLFTNNGTGDKYSFDTYSEAVKAILGYQHDASEFMYRTMLVNHTALAKKFAAEDLADARAYSMVVTDAVERERIDAAAEATVFLNFMQPLMTVLQFIFYAASPIMALIMVASPAGGLVKAGMYVLFGIWAHSWMPFAAIVNAYIQNSIAHAITDGTDLTALNITLNQIPGFYNLVANKLAAASNIMGAVPIVSGALLMGSPFAMAQLGQRFASGGKVESGTMAPEMVSSAPVAQGGSRYTEHAGDLASSGGVSFTGAQKAGAVEFGSGDTMAKVSSVARENVASSQATVNRSAQNMLDVGMKNQGMLTTSSGSTVSVENATRQALMQSLKERMGSQYDEEEARAFLSSMSKLDSWRSGFSGNASVGPKFLKGGYSAERMISEIEGISSSEGNTFKTLKSLATDIIGDESFGVDVASKFAQTLSENDAHTSETSAAERDLSSSKEELTRALTYQEKTSDLNSTQKEIKSTIGGNAAELIETLSRNGSMDIGGFISQITGGDNGQLFESVADTVSSTMPDAYGKTGPGSRALQLTNSALKLMAMDDDQIRAVSGMPNLTDTQIDSIRERSAEAVNKLVSAMGYSEEPGSAYSAGVAENRESGGAIEQQVQTGQKRIGDNIKKQTLGNEIEAERVRGQTQNGQRQDKSRIKEGGDLIPKPEDVSTVSGPSESDIVTKQAKEALKTTGTRSDSKTPKIEGDYDKGYLMYWLDNESGTGNHVDFVAGMATPGASIPFIEENSRKHPIAGTIAFSAHSTPLSKDSSFGDNIRPIKPENGERPYTQSFEGAQNFLSSIVDTFNSQSGAERKENGKAQSAVNAMITDLGAKGIVPKDELGLLISLDSYQEAGRSTHGLVAADAYLSEKYGENYSQFLKQNDVSNFAQYVDKSGEMEVANAALDGLLEIHGINQPKNEVPDRENVVDSVISAQGNVSGIFSQPASGNPKSVK